MKEFTVGWTCLRGATKNVHKILKGLFLKDTAWNTVKLGKKSLFLELQALRMGSRVQKFRKLSTD
jgi:hypothetical protein